jgi:pimeloyl-ACP methyl ester carboxylesterase
MRGILLRLALHQFDAKDSARDSEKLAVSADRTDQADPATSQGPIGASLRASPAAASAGAPKSDLIFIHGTGSSAQMWAPQVDLLTSLGYRCFVIDLRGHGQSAEPGEHTDLAVHVGDVLETIEDSAVRLPAVFVGHSLGSIISVTLAEQRPELISLIFAAGFPGRILKPVTMAFEIFMKSGFERIKATNVHKGWAFRPRTLIETDKHSLDQIVANFGNLDFVTNLPKLHCRVHIASGRFDPVAPCIYAEKVHRALPSSTFKVFEMAGHNFMDTHPKTFNRWLVDGLKEFEQGPIAAGSGE